MASIISGDNLWAMWAIVAGITALAFYTEQKFTWGAKISAVLLALIASLILVNVGVIPTSSPVYGTLGEYVLPLAIPLLLFQSNLKKIVKESGRLFLIFHVAAIFSVIGGIICGFLFKGALADQTAGMVAVEVGVLLVHQEDRLVAPGGTAWPGEKPILQKIGHFDFFHR